MEIGSDNNHWAWMLLVVAIIASFVGATYIIGAVMHSITLVQSFLG